MTDIIISSLAGIVFAAVLLLSDSLIFGCLGLFFVLFASVLIVRNPASYAFKLRTHIYAYFSIEYRYLALFVALLVFGFLLPAVGFNASFIVAFIIVAFYFRFDNRSAFVVALVSLGICPFLIIIRQESLAETCAIFAYYFLWIGVGWEIWEQVKITNQVANLQYIIHDRVENVLFFIKEKILFGRKQIQAIRFEVPSFKPRFVLPSLPHVHMPPVIFASTAPNATPLSPVSSAETIVPPKGKRFVDRVLEINDRINEVLFKSIKTVFSRVTMISLPKISLPKISLPKMSFSDIGNGGRKGLDAILELNDKINTWFYGLMPKTYVKPLKEEAVYSISAPANIVKQKETPRFSLPKITITFDFKSRLVVFLRETKFYFVDFGLAVRDVARDVTRMIVRIIEKGFVGLRSQVQLFFARRRESFARFNRELAILVEKSKQDTDRIINAYEEKLQKVKAPELSVQMPKLSVPREIQNPFAGFSLPKIEVPKVEVPKIVFPHITNPFSFSAGYFSGGLFIGIIASIMLFIPHISIKLPAFKRPVFVAVKSVPTVIQKSIATPTPDARPHMDVLAAVGSEGRDMSAVSDMVSVSSHQKQELGYYQTVLFYRQGEEHTAQMIAEKLSLSALLKEDESIESDLLLVLR